MDTHLRTLAILFLLFAAIGGAGSLLIILSAGGLGPLMGMSEEMSMTDVPTPSLILALALSFTLLLSIPTFIAGYGLLHLRPWSRVLGIICSSFWLPVIPLGPILGAYGFWVLMSVETEPLFSESSLNPWKS